MRKSDATSAEISNATDIIDNWRASHAYPLHVFYMNLRRIAKKRNDIIVAERLKRLDSIVDKLKREQGMKLSRMQDLGGCRIVFPTLSEVYTYSEKLRNSRIRHIFKREHDYIRNPKTSGYRSLHLIYKFQSDTSGLDIYNNNMLIELQFRTHLQHIWATALETMGLFTHQALKAGKGSNDIKRFFVLISSLFAIKEHCPVVPGTIEDEKELISEVEQINDDFHILEMLSAICVAIDHEAEKKLDKKGYYILRLNYEIRRLRISYFKPSEAEQANLAYNNLEKETEGKPIDVVLVRTASFNTVKAAYPNYFMDISEFVKIVSEYLH
ncbi:RelA/SpoT domain-containing protein [Caproicibacterium amylolyticum]|uniref:RelA/SpoT domain-containing protein n=2 Tax=Caproicibacterium amylolyticum TaxID=2766537 RepID=A0A7G9WL63_9FIRM|nr:RelA/SpoT domain-containing protein [Caproicibacterium amylolyticum]